MLKILFLCTGNSCRSQMAEGWGKHLKNKTIEFHSAGTDPKGMSRLAIKAMDEVGVDILTHNSKHLDELSGLNFDYVVTLCGHAHETCPLFPGDTKTVHFGFDDPPLLAESAATDEEALPHYRRVRDEIKSFVEQLPDNLA